MKSRMKKSWVMGLTVAGVLSFAGLSQAAVTINFIQNGPDVLVTATGTLVTTGLVQSGPFNQVGYIAANVGLIMVGPAGVGATNEFKGISGPASFGLSPGADASSGTGGFVGVYGLSNAVFLPTGYVSGSAINSTSVYEDSTFASIGFTPGTYVYTWASDSLTVQVGAIPEPSAALLASLGLAAGLIHRKRRVY
jgi:hypothetical protein